MSSIDGSLTSIFWNRRTQCPVLLEVLAELVISGRTHATQGSVPASQRRLQQVRGIHCPAGGRARADHRVNLVDEKDRVRMFLQFALSPAFSRSSKSPR